MPTENVDIFISLFIYVFIKKEALAQVLSCEFFEISKNTFFHRTPLVAASATSQKRIKLLEIIILCENVEKTIIKNKPADLWSNRIPLFHSLIGVEEFL